jgi:cytochrome c
MKTIAIGMVLAMGVAAAGAAYAGEEELAQKSGCFMCHAVDAKKIGPSFKHEAAELKGKSDAEVFAKWKGVKNHTMVKAPEEDVRKVLKWVLTLQ